MGKRRSKIKGGFVPIPNILIGSELWQRLQGSDIKVYVGAVRSAWKHPEGFTLPHSKFKRLMSNDTLLKARRRLVELGFLEEIQKGGLLCNASLFKLSEKWKEETTVRKNIDKINISEEKRKETAKLYQPYGGLIET